MLLFVLVLMFRCWAKYEFNRCEFALLRRCKEDGNWDQIRCLWSMKKDAQIWIWGINWMFCWNQQYENIWLLDLRWPDGINHRFNSQNLPQNTIIFHPKLFYCFGQRHFISSDYDWLILNSFFWAESWFFLIHSFHLSEWKNQTQVHILYPPSHAYCHRTSSTCVFFPDLFLIFWIF